MSIPINLLRIVPVMMMPSRYYTMAATCAMMIVVQLAASYSAVASQPNVILIMADDQGYGDMSCHGNPVLKTPHMDQLYAESVRLTDFHVAPMCSPTRGQLMTGRDAMKTGCTAVCQGRSMTRAEIPTMADFFTKSGYATGHFGKWHMGDSYPHRPQDRGFQETLHHRAWGITSLADYWGNSYFDPVLNHNGTDKKMPGYCTDIFFDQAMEWIDQQRQTEAPFFVYLPTNTPHVPNVCEEKYSAPYVGRHEGKNIPAKFFGMIANLDENLGRLERFLKDRDLRDNTLLIYMSDNGTQSNEAKELFNAGMRDKKTSVFEGGHRVPCFVRWPDGKLRHGTDVTTLTQVQDLLPTLVDLCELSSAKRETQFDGTSLTGLLKGTTTSLPDRKLVIQYRVSGEKWAPAVVLWNKWRLVGPGRLYNVAEDPHQDRNVATEHPQIAQALENHYDSWHAEAKKLFDKPRWIHVGTDTQNPMMLYAQDWVGDYCDNRGGLTQGRAVGAWNIEVAQAGIYELVLRRWPEESKLPLNTGYGPDFLRGPRGQRPVAGANVQIAGKNFTLDSQPDDTHLTFRVQLQPGKQQLLTHLIDTDDQVLCSAMYVKLTRLTDSGIAETPQSNRKPKRIARQALPSKRTRPMKPVKLSSDDILMADFEGSNFGDWAASGEAFKNGPTVTKGRIAGHQGKRVLDTFIANNGDGPTGKLTSPDFIIDRTKINFLIGGGKTQGKTCVNLLVDGKVVRTATGNATKVGGQKLLRWTSWDVSDLKGKSARIEITDLLSAGWGHIVVDHIYRSNQAPKTQ